MLASKITLIACALYYLLVKIRDLDLSIPRQTRMQWNNQEDDITEVVLFSTFTSSSPWYKFL